jgi:hypothetical protein
MHLSAAHFYKYPPVTWTVKPTCIFTIIIIISGLRTVPSQEWTPRSKQL